MGDDYLSFRLAFQLDDHHAAGHSVTVLPVLVGVAGEGSDVESELGFAAGAASRAGSAVRLVHMLGEGASAGPAERLLRTSAARVESLSKGSVPVGWSVVPGDTVPGLVRLSREAGLVVLQRRPLSRLQRLVRGSLTVKVAGQAHAPTVSVPTGWSPRRSSVRARLVVGVDGDGEETIALPGTPWPAPMTWTPTSSSCTAGSCPRTTTTRSSSPAP